MCITEGENDMNDIVIDHVTGRVQMESTEFLGEIVAEHQHVLFGDMRILSFEKEFSW